MQEGDIVKGEITSIKPYGAFVKLNRNLYGLIHISEFSDRYVRDIEDYVSVGDVLDLEVISIQDDTKVSLSFKTLHKRKKRLRIKLKTGFTPLREKIGKWIADYDAKDGE